MSILTIGGNNIVNDNFNNKAGILKLTERFWNNSHFNKVGIVNIPTILQTPVNKTARAPWPFSCITWNDKKKWLLITNLNISPFSLTSRKQLFADVLQNSALKIFANFTGKDLCWSLFLINLKTFRFANLFKRGSNTGIFLWNLWNF